ncbi:MAG: hypothetical protein AB7I57_18280 [Pirellulales bacterium]
MGATNPDDPRTDFAACWGRLARQWLLPSDPTVVIELTVADLEAALMELFTAGGVHHVAQTRRLFDTLATNPALADLAVEAAYGRRDLPDTELEPPIDPELA